MSQCVKVLKVYVFSPESHSLGQACLKITKTVKINAYLGVPQVLQSFIYFRM